MKIKLKEIQCQTALWPYIAFVNSENRIWLTCGHNNKEHTRIDFGMNKKDAKFLKIYISPTYDMYCLIQKFKPKGLEVWRVDLN